MEFFYVKRSTGYTRKTNRGQLLVRYEKPTDDELRSGRVNLSHIYFATPSLISISKKEFEVQKNELIVLNETDKNTILSLDVFPVNLTAFGNNDVIKSNQRLIDKKKDEIKIVVINGFGAAIGDIIIGTSALDIYDKFLKQFFRKVEYYVYNEHLDAAKEVLEKNRRINGILPYPSPASILLNFDAYIDLGAMIIWDIFNDRPMFDFYLSAFGIKHETIPPYLKRTKLFYDIDPNSYTSKFMDGMRLGRPLLLFNPESTTSIRSIPSDLIPKIIRQLIQKTDYHIVLLKDYGIKNKRVSVLSKYSSTLLDYMAIISKVDKIITVDTSTYHISDYFSIPTVVLFTTINPLFRVKYYPFVKPYKVLRDDSKLMGKHMSQKEEDQKEIREAFEKLNVDDVIKLLEE